RRGRSRQRGREPWLDVAWAVSVNARCRCSEAGIVAPEAGARVGGRGAAAGGEAMDFAISDAAREACARLRRVVDERVVPLEAEFFAGGFGTVRAALDEVRTQVRAEGLWAPQLPAALGGMGLSLLDFGLV